MPFARTDSMSADLRAHSALSIGSLTLGLLRMPPDAIVHDKSRSGYIATRSPAINEPIETDPKECEMLVYIVPLNAWRQRTYSLDSLPILQTNTIYRRIVLKMAISSTRKKSKNSFFIQEHPTALDGPLILKNCSQSTFKAMSNLLQARN